jgi:hypothetical protein
MQASRIHQQRSTVRDRQTTGETGKTSHPVPQNHSQMKRAQGTVPPARQSTNPQQNPPCTQFRKNHHTNVGHSGAPAKHSYLQQLWKTQPAKDSTTRANQSHRAASTNSFTRYKVQTFSPPITFPGATINHVKDATSKRRHRQARGTNQSQWAASTNGFTRHQV